MSLIGSNVEEKIYNFLHKRGYSDAGIFGIMGNLFAESGLISNRIEISREEELGTSSYYTACINDKTYTKEQFVNDEAGYGLAQWTYHTRKKALYEATVEKNISIDDLEAQLAFLCSELKSYTKLNKLLKTTTDYEEASDAVLKDFERPAILDYTERRSYAKKYHDMFTPESVDDTNTEDDSNVNNNTTTVDPDKNDKYEKYIVQSGDSWWSIADDKLGSGVKMTTLAEFNGTTIDHVLHPNDIILLPIEKEKDEVLKDDEPSSDMIDTPYFTMYTVLPGDSWWSIAERKLGSGSKMYTLAEYNGFSTDHMLHPGDVLKVPCKITTDPEYKLYTVKSGDGWWRIAQKEMGSGSMMHRLAEYNGKTIKHILHPCDVIKIPK